MLNRRVVFCLLATACTDAPLQPQVAEPTNVDDKLALEGNICTSLPDPSGFPVKVVLVVDESGSMCVSDPPGSQSPNDSFCADALRRIAQKQVLPDEPARVRALKQLFARFSQQPNVSIALLPFETNVKGRWPASGFAQISNGLLGEATARAKQLQSELGKGTDYQGALSAAYGLISSDIATVERTSPELLPRTRYVVVFLTDGTPFPKCAANDDLMQYADADHPDLLWADSSGAGGATSNFCNQIDPEPCMDPMGSECVFGFVKGTDRNQNYQLYAYVDQLLELKSSHNIGDVRLHTVLLFNEEAVKNCGDKCTDIYGTYPGTPEDQYPQAAHKIARHILKKLADRGNGIFQEFEDNAGVANFSLGAVDYSSLAARNAMKTLMVRGLSAMPGDDHRILDADGDGLPDTRDNGFADSHWKAQQFSADGDADCFDDNFEVMHVDDGFRPDVPDGRGCIPDSPLSLGCACRDTDGDGLSQFAEDYLHTRQTVLDTDGDGLPDGVEVRYGLNPLVPQTTGLDTDGDGLSDIAELRADTSPIRRDEAFFGKRGYQYEVTPREQSDGRVCYDFKVSNLELVKSDGAPGATRIGFNLFKVYFAESPESGVATDYGVWRTACAWAQYAPPSVRLPAGPALAFEPRDFHPPSTMAGDPSTWKHLCVGSPP